MEMEALQKVHGDGSSSEGLLQEEPHLFLCEPMWF